MFLTDAELFAGVRSVTGTGNSAYVLLAIVVAAELLGMGIIFVIALFVSHSMAGPIYRIEKLSKKIGQGDLSVGIHIRKNDEFQDLAEKLDGMVAHIRSRLASIKEVTGDLVISGNELAEMGGGSGDERLAASCQVFGERLSVLSGLLESMKVE